MYTRELPRESVKKLLKCGIVLISALLLIAVLFFCFANKVQASELSLSVKDASGKTNGMDTMDVLFLFLFLAVMPSLLLMMTSFTRIIISLSFLRHALGTQQSPPNQVLLGLALILSLFIMTPVLDKINEDAYQPYQEGTITRDEAFERAQVPLKEFMLKNTEKKSLDLFMQISKTKLPEIEEGEGPQRYMPLSLTVIVPSFMLSELNRAFTIGFLIFIPFLIVDMVVASTLMSMGMVMLPPTMIAMPFKIMLFVLVDGWGMMIKTLVQGFR